MDQVTHQVPRSGVAAYRYMAYPLPKQPLQTLYPGRLMQADWHYSGDNIPNENVVGLEETRKTGVAFSRAAEMENEALARHLGGKYKIVRHPAVEPEATIEDPGLRGLTMGGQGPSPDLQNVPSVIDNLNAVEREDASIVRDVRRNQNNFEGDVRRNQNNFEGDVRRNQNNFEGDVREGFEIDTSKSKETPFLPVFSKNKMLFISIGLIIIFIIFLYSMR